MDRTGNIKNLFFEVLILLAELLQFGPCLFVLLCQIT